MMCRSLGRIDEQDWQLDPCIQLQYPRVGYILFATSGESHMQWELGYHRMDSGSPLFHGDESDIARALVQGFDTCDNIFYRHILRETKQLGWTLLKADDRERRLV